MIIQSVKIYIGIALIYASCISNDDPNKMKITIFEPQCRVDTLINNNKMSTYLVIPYLVEGYKNTAAHEVRLDSFICAKHDSTWSNYADCLFPIYKKSKYTNNENIKKHPEDIYEYSNENDFLFEYRWSKEIGYTKLFLKFKSHNDKVICK